MDENKITKTAMLIALTGIVLLFFFLKLSDLKSINLETIDEVPDGSKVKVNGIVKNIIKSESTTRIEIMQPITKEILIFDANVKLKTGDKIEVIADIDQGNIVAQRIRKIT